MVTVNIGNWSFGIGSRASANRRRPFALVILDGWGYSPGIEGNSIANANTPFYDFINANFPKTLLEASGERVGLSPGTPGNSEIGHLCLGSGRIVADHRTRIQNAINSGAFFHNPILKQAFARVRNRKSAVHLVGLLSDANENSSIESLFALLKMAKRERVREVYVHAILDGKDVDDRTAEIYVEALQIKLADIGCGELASVCGRHFAMDANNNWELTARAFTMLVHSDGERANDPESAIRGAYLRGLSDHMIPPIVFEKGLGKSIGKIAENDTVIFFNHRSAPIRQLATALINNKNRANAEKPFVDAVSLIEIEPGLRSSVAFSSAREPNVLGEVFSENGITNCRLAEPERYPHVTYFFNGGIESQFPGESRIEVPVHEIEREQHTTDFGCLAVTDNFISRLDQRPEEILIANLATTEFQASRDDHAKNIEAIELVDKCLGNIIRKIREIDGVALITSDHGKFEQMTDSRIGLPRFAGTDNPVPFHLLASDAYGMRLRDDGALEDVAPTILGMLGIAKPFEMTGSDLRIL